MSARRGQTMVLGVLFLFLTTLMVFVTLSVGQRTRERIEAQIAADAAAYSNAVVTARTLNELALINRTRTSMFVAMLGVQSLISWSGHHRSHLHATNLALEEAKAPYTPCCGNIFCPQNACSCAELSRLSGAQAAIATEQARVKAGWNGLDSAAGTYASDLWKGAIALNDSSREALARLELHLDDQALANIIAKTASPELAAPARGDTKSREETKDSKGCKNLPGLYCSENELHNDRTTMLGTRGWHFVTNRNEPDDLVRQKLEALVSPFNPAVGISPPAKRGGAGAGPDKELAQQLKGHPGSHYFGEDHGGTLALDWPSACIPSGGKGRVVDAFVRSNHSDMSEDKHAYEGSSEPASRHNLNLHATDVKSSSPWSFEYNFHQVDEVKNDFGQPKLYAIVERDFAQRTTPWPWDLMFRFRFSKNDDGATFDLGRTSGGFKTPSGADLQHQVAISSAIAYYHRPGHWAEPPNLWNPFWRATLYAPDDDLARHLDKAGFPEHADTLRRLLKAGMAGTR